MQSTGHPLRRHNFMVDRLVGRTFGEASAHYSFPFNAPVPPVFCCYQVLIRLITCSQWSWTFALFSSKNDKGILSCPIMITTFPNATLWISREGITRLSHGPHDFGTPTHHHPQVRGEPLRTCHYFFHMLIRKQIRAVIKILKAFNTEYSESSK